jgi:tetratricopeptide (TPR) repeat protein
MKTRLPVLLFVSLTLASAGCARIRAKAAYQDGNTAYKEENFKRAIENYSRAVQYEPDMAEAWFYLGSSQQSLYRPGKDTPENKQRLDDAIAAYKKSLEVNKGTSANLKQVKLTALSALTAIYTEDPYRDFDQAKQYADQLISENPNDTKNLYAMANLYEKFGKIDDAEATYKKVTELYPNDPKACSALAGFYNKPNWDDKGNVWEDGSDKARRSKFDDAITTLEHCAELAPDDPGGWQKVASFYWDKAYRDPLLDDKHKNEYADKGLEAVDKALKLKPDYFEAVIYKGLLYRVKAAVTTNGALRAQYLEEAQALQKQGLELKKEQDAATAAAGATTPGS